MKNIKYNASESMNITVLYNENLIIDVLYLLFSLFLVLRIKNPTYTLNATTRNDWYIDIAQQRHTIDMVALSNDLSPSIALNDVIADITTNRIPIAVVSAWLVNCN
ncbi:hypothetical protein VEE31_17380 [Escherichia coli]|nr:hypothetical protein VEE31_17380 [Escherichia coli]